MPVSKAWPLRSGAAGRGVRRGQVERSGDELPSERHAGRVMMAVHRAFSRWLLPGPDRLRSLSLQRCLVGAGQYWAPQNERLSLLAQSQRQANTRSNISGLVSTLVVPSVSLAITTWSR